MIESFVSLLVGSAEIDERFLAHRYRASRFALIMGVITLGYFILYDFFVHDVIRTDLWIVVGVIAVSKIGAMAFFRLTR
jgi:hypothetical protein